MSVHPASEGIAVGQVERTRVQVEETGEEVTVRDTFHEQTNHYIRESRPYFPNTELRTYIKCPYFLRLSYMLCFASLYGVLGATSLVPAPELPLSFFFACLIFFLIYCQHERVNQKTLPIVQHQPVIYGQRLGNNFYEVTVTDLKGVALANYRAGIGFVQLTQGTIKFQAFNEEAAHRMSLAKCHSRVLLVLFFVMSVYNLYYTAVAFSKS